MKVALIHDYIKEYGGAERVLEALHEVWPDAPVYTSVYLPQFLGPHKERFDGWDIQTSWFQYVPLKEKLISLFRILAPFAFRSFDFSAFDVVIVSATGAYNPNSIEKKSALQICYCHTPPRYLYGYATAREWKKNPFVRVVGEIGNHILRMIDFKSAQNVDYFVANSKEVAARIKKFYRRDSVVIYPPSDTARGPVAGFPPAPRHSSGQASVQSAVYPEQRRRIGSPSSRVTPRSYYLAGGRLARPKHIDLIVRACQELRVPLKVFGRDFAGYEQELKIQNAKIKVADQNAKIQFVGEVTDEEKFELMRGAKAFIFASEDEDFGITPVEAMAAGTPVIAYRSGGVQESVIDGKTGIFFDKLTVGSLVGAIKQLSNTTIRPVDCIKQAKKFSKERFQREVEKFVLEAAKKKNARNEE